MIEPIGLSFTGRLTIVHKMLLMLLSFLLPLFILAGFVYKGVHHHIDFAAAERRGLEYHRTLGNALREVLRHHILSQRALGAERNLLQDLPAVQSSVDKALEDLESVDKRLGGALGFTQDTVDKRKGALRLVPEIKAAWTDLKDRTSSLAPETAAARHHQLAADLRGMIGHVADASNLILDPDLDSYYMMDAVLLSLPQARERLAWTISRGHAALKAGGALPPADRVKLAIDAAMLRESDMDRVAADVGAALREDGAFYGESASLQKTIPPLMQRYRADTEAFLALFPRAVDADAGAVPADDFRNAGEAALEAAFSLESAAADELDALLARRIASHRSSLFMKVLFSAAALALAILLSLAFLRRVRRGLRECVESLHAQSALDFTRRTTVSTDDEVGQMARDMNETLGRVKEAIQAIADNAQRLSGSSDNLSAVSQELSANASETAAQATVVSAAADEFSRNVQTVSTGAEEMGASIKEVAQNANQAAKVALSAVKMAETANATVGKLGQSSGEIDQVIKVITSIAEQTNLLALNATIEAARAGEAGKGFAVVANEVKDLAKETTKATEDIGAKIEAIQKDAKSAVQAIAQIGQIINQISDIQNTIASAVEEQSVTTNEIGRNAAEAARGSAEIAQNISAVAQAVQGSTENAVRTRRSAEELSRMSLDLQKLLGRFTV